VSTTNSDWARPESFYGYAESVPDRVAVITSGASMTFGALGARVNQVGRALQSAGYQPGDRLAQVVHNTLAYWEVTLAAGQIGLTTVPLNNTLTPPEMDYILADSGARGIVAPASFATKLSAAAAELPSHRWAYGAAVEGWSSWMEFGANESTEPPPDRRFGAAMGYTSGTSGRPKGVGGHGISHLTPEDGALGPAGLTMMFGSTTAAGSVHLCCSPLYHSAPAAFALGSLHMGHTVVCLEKFDAKASLDAIEKHAVTTVFMVPTHFHRLLALPESQRSAADLSSLDAVIHAGAPCPPATKSAMLHWLGPVVWEFYGATEGMVSICSPQQALSHPGTVGRAAPGVSIMILDEDDAEVPPGTEGTIYFRRHVSFEYHNDPDKTAASRRHGHATVGDIGHLDEDGYLYLADRREDVIITGGVNVYPAEVEARLIEHPAVRDVAVVASPDPEWGALVTAVIEPVEGTATGPEFAEELRNWSRESLAGPKVPRVVTFTDSLPRSAAGKLSRRKVRERLLAAQD
jgi:long-chain acyl-CoA synthetase